MRPLPSVVPCSNQMALGGPELLILLGLLVVVVLVVVVIICVVVLAAKKGRGGGDEEVKVRIEELEKQKADGAISEEDFEQRRKAILRGE